MLLFGRRGENSYSEELYSGEGEELERGKEVTKVGDISKDPIELLISSNLEAFMY